MINNIKMKTSIWCFCTHPVSAIKNSFLSVGYLQKIILRTFDNKLALLNKLNILKDKLHPLSTFFSTLHAKIAMPDL